MPEARPASGEDQARPNLTARYTRRRKILAAAIVCALLVAVLVWLATSRPQERWTPISYTISVQVHPASEYYLLVPAPVEANGTLARIASEFEPDANSSVSLTDTPYGTALNVTGHGNLFLQSGERRPYDPGWTLDLQTRHPNGLVEGPGNTRILIGPNGEVTISGRSRALFLNFGDRGRAEEFLARHLAKHPNDVIKSFEVPEFVLDDIRSLAIPEAGARSVPGYLYRPYIVDQSVAANQYMLRGDWIDYLQTYIIQGTGRIG